VNALRNEYRRLIDELHGAFDANLGARLGAERQLAVVLRVRSEAQHARQRRHPRNDHLCVVEVDIECWFANVNLIHRCTCSLSVKKKSKKNKVKKKVLLALLSNREDSGGFL
jgi:hypothetical protein